MPRLVLTVIGDDRAGLVEALADAVNAHGGNWEQSQMAELAGQFAGIVVVTVPAERADELREALDGLEGLLEVAAHPGSEEPAGADHWRRLRIDLVGSDRPGIVHDVSAVLARHGLSIETITTERRDAPMSGGILFEAHIAVRVPPGGDPADVRQDLEQVASELFVDLTVGQE
ncbi:glycine cleavage system protein R [Agromyces aurantiacus]|uniref:Glycine cleavage system protein R n=1 Tax=Agromyces aurantiacus TaxID=165814 RepID=A0ABV9R0T4_9MICO|nr:ACT domain-containing protein [Agromyces aurantiacus]MBM7505771.1 glycine cleavage system regulatory protein [Agromyces aurantiacus]